MQPRHGGHLWKKIYRGQRRAAKARSVRQVAGKVDKRVSRRPGGCFDIYMYAMGVSPGG
ncbi:hypothetical protein AK973_0782 [Pseudomonas brassicacearum]|nr:hypothetical protein AK973_0782 [Pseudomonas brassicacearum]